MIHSQMCVLHNYEIFKKCFTSLLEIETVPSLYWAEITTMYISLFLFPFSRALKAVATNEHAATRTVFCRRFREPATLETSQKPRLNSNLSLFSFFIFLIKYNNNENE